MIKFFKKFHFFIFLTLLLVLGFLWSPDVRANDSLEVTFEQDPLFYETNFLPGDSTTGWIKVKNNSGSSQSIFIWTNNVADPDNLGDTLNLEIEEQTNTLYGNTLSNLFTLNNVYLSDLPSGNQTQYDFTIAFDILAGNEYQEKSLQFDLLIGSSPPEEGEEEEEEEENGGTTFAVITGGGGGAPITLQIFNVKTTNILKDGATITWQTTLFSTSQVIYSAEDEDHDFNPDNPSYYGYSHIYPDPEDSTMVTFHTILLPNLEPCTTYYYRVVSHRASPGSLTISSEYSFTTLCIMEEIEEEEEEEEEEVWIPLEEEEGVGETEEAGETEEGEEALEEAPLLEEAEIPEEESEAFRPFLLAAIGDAAKNLGEIFSLCFNCFPWWLILIFVIWPLTKGIATLSRSKKEANLLLKKHFKKEGIIWLVSLLIPLILALWLFLSEYYCLPVWVFLILTFIYLLLWFFITEEKEKIIRKIEGKETPPSIKEKFERNFPFLPGIIVLLIFLATWLKINCLPFWLISLLIVGYFISLGLLRKKLKK